MNKDDEKNITFTRIFAKVTAAISYQQKKKLEFIAESKNLPVTRIVGHLIDLELLKEKPFNDYNMTIPNDEFEDCAFLDQAVKILDFMKKHKVKCSLGMIYLLREDIGVPDVYELKMGFRDLIDKGFLVEAPRASHLTFIDETYYMVKENNIVVKKKMRKKASEYDMYHRLKKKYEGK